MLFTTLIIWAMIAGAGALISAGFRVLGWLLKVFWKILAVMLVVSAAVSLMP